MASPGLKFPSDEPIMNARTAAQVKKISSATHSLEALEVEIVNCQACARLTKWCAQVAVEKKRAYIEEEYWGKPVPGFGSTSPHIVLLGLAPGAHGANRTGRVFTGDRSGDFLFASMHRVGLANQPTSERRGDGLELIETRILTAVRCAPPGNKPTPVEQRNCEPWAARELALVADSARVYVAFGSFAWSALWSILAEPWGLGRRPPFRHGGRFDHPRGTLLASYHPSQQNTFTGTLTEGMLDEVLGLARTLAKSEKGRSSR